MLAGRKTVGAISGKVMFGGHHASKNFLRRYTAYVEQFGGRPRHRSCGFPVLQAWFGHTPSGVSFM